MPNRNIHEVFVTREMVKEKLDDIIGDEDLSRYVL
jgi:ATP-dependent protease HslVU (ClpYQ) ATPase subunit